MGNQQIIIPNGWTYYAHRSNTERWSENPFDEKSIKVKNLMSVVTERDIYEDVSRYGKRSLKGYSGGNGTPFEIRCLICDLKHLREMPNDSEMKNVMLNEFYFDRRNFGGACGQRHHSIPPREELVVLGIGSYDEVYERDSSIIWTIPRRFVGFYKDELKKGENRAIGLNAEDGLQKDSVGISK